MRPLAGGGGRLLASVCVGLVLAAGLAARAGEAEDRIRNGSFDGGTWTDLRGHLSPDGWTQARGTSMNTTDAKVQLGDFASGNPPAVRLEESGGNSALWQEIAVPEGYTVQVAVYFSTDPSGGGSWGSWQLLNLTASTTAMTAYAEGGWMDDWYQVTQYGTAGSNMHAATYQRINWKPATSNWLRTAYGPFASSGKVVIILHASRASQFDNVQVLVEPKGTVGFLR